MSEGGRSRSTIGVFLLPDAESCCLAFQWLLRDASKCVSKLAGIHEENPNKSSHAYYHDDEDMQPSIME